MSGTSRQSPLLLSIFSTFAVGGPQVRFAAIANHFGRSFRHIIVAMDADFACSSRLSPDLDVTLLSVDNRKGDTLGNRGRFRNLLRSLRPDCVVTYNWGAIEWAMANWPHIVRHVHIEDGFGPEEIARPLLRRSWTRRLVLRGTTVVVPSHQLERIASRVWKLDRSRLRYIPNGIDCARFSNRELEPLVARDGRPVIGTVAALRPEKNLVRFLDSFRSVRATRPCRLVIAGDGPEREQLEAHATRIGVMDDVVFTGYRADTERIYAAMDIFVLSSDTEQMPTSVLEAMAAGLPIASSDVGDVASMVSALNKPYVVPAIDLVTPILTLLEDGPMRSAIGEANQVRVRTEFSEDRMFDAYGALFGGKEP